MKNAKRILRPLLTIVFAGLLVGYIASQWSSFADISLTNPLLLILTIPLVVISIYASGAVNEIAIEPHGVKVSRNELFGLASITRFTNQFAPSYVGASVRAVYFKKKHDISYTKFSSSFLITNILQLIISGLAALLAFSISAQNETSGLWFVFVLIPVLAALFAMPLGWVTSLFTKLHARFSYKPIERLSVLPGEFVKVRSHPGMLVRTIGWMLVMIVSSAGIIYLLYAALGLNINPLAALFIGALSSWGLVLSITPAGLGVREGIMVFSAYIMGIAAPISLVVSFLLRVVVLIVAGILSVHYSRKLAVD